MKVVALDLSLTSTGVADSDALESPWRITPDGLDGVVRLYWVMERIVAATEGADLVVLEGYSYASRYQAHQLGELGGVVRLALWTRDRFFVELAPSARCYLATGKGNAKKDAVLGAAIRRLGYAGNSHDEADARWLLEAALQHYKLPGAAKLPASHTAKLSSYAWPAELSHDQAPEGGA